MSEQMVKDWELYLAGKRYNERLKPNYYETANANIDFFAGNQWRNSGETEGLMKPVFNIIKRITTFFVASLTSSNASIQFEPLAFNDRDNEPDLNAAEVAGAEVENLFEKFNMDNRRRDALFQAAIKGDVAGHYYFDPTKKPYRGKLGADIEGEICFEIISGSNVFFGNANNPDVDVQPYIIISGRDMVENLKAEAKHYKKKDKPGDTEITADLDYQDETGEGGQIEVEAEEGGKALYIIKYYRDPETKIIKASKCVKNAYIYQNVETGLSYYPLAWMVWEKQENQYHGRALATGIIPNQIFINKMFAMVMYNLMMTAFPKAVYNADHISGWNNEIGTAIGVKGQDVNFPIKNLAGYLEAGNMSAQITQVIEMAMNYTKETLGINDVALGNVNPTNTSAIIAVQKASIIPLENIRANLYEWIEDQGRILLDMMGTNYGLRPLVMTREGKKVVEQFDFSAFKELWLQSKVDIGEASYWSEIASIQTLDNLLKGGLIELVDYLERLPDGYIPKRQEWINKLKAMVPQTVASPTAPGSPQAPGAPQIPPMPGMPGEMGVPMPAAPEGPPQSDYEQMATFFESLPPEVQAKLKSLTPDEMEQEILAMMQQQTPA